MVYTSTLGIGGAIWFFNHNTWYYGEYRFYLIFLIALACILLVYIPKFSKLCVCWLDGEALA